MDRVAEVGLFGRVPPPVKELLVALVVVVTVLMRVPEQVGDRTPLGYLAVLVPAGLIMLRHRRPWAVLAACVVLQCVAATTFSISPFTSLACMIAVYTVSVAYERRTAVITGVTVAVPLVVVSGIAVGRVTDPMVVPIAVQIAFAVALGQAVRVRRAYIAEITDRALRAEATREAEASRRVAEDRLRVARDLHDAVAHQITVISLNAGVASSTIRTRPEAAAEALLTVRESARLVLREIGDLLATLRSPEEAAEPVRALGLGGVADLVADFTRNGLQTTLEVCGDVSALPPAVDITAFRVIQEGLTNALRHGTGTAQVRVVVDAAELAVTISNPISSSTDGPRDDPGRELVAAGSSGLGSGHGLVGMAERAASLRGTFTHGRRGSADLFVVDARLPLGTPGPAAEKVRETRKGLR